MVLDGEEELECKVCIDWIRLEYVPGFKYLGCVLDESGTDEPEYSRKVVSGKRVAGAIRSSLVIAKGLEIECARVLNESLPVHILIYSSETNIRKENERSKIRVVQTDNLRGLLGNRRMDRVLNTRIKEFCGVTKVVDERLDSVK